MPNWSRTLRMVCISSSRLVGVHAGGRLVQQQQLRVRGQGAGNLQLALLAVGQLAGLDVGLLVQVQRS